MGSQLIAFDLKVGSKSIKTEVDEINRTKITINYKWNINFLLKKIP